MNIQATSSQQSYKDMMNALGKTPEERLENFYNRDRFSLPKSEMEEWLKEQSADGVLMLSFDCNGDVYSINIASKGDNELTEFQIHDLLEQYDFGDMTVGEAAHLYAELSMLGVISGGLAKQSIDALLNMGPNNGRKTSFQSIINGIVESRTKDENFIKNYATNPSADIWADKSIRKAIEEKNRLLDILDKLNA